MYSHIAAFGATAFDGSGGNVTLPFITDGLLRSYNNALQCPEDFNAVWAYGGGSGITSVRFSSGFLRIKGYPHLSPLSATVAPGDNPVVSDLRSSPMLFRENEDVTVQVTNGGAQDTMVIVCLYRGAMTMNSLGQSVRKVRFTATAPNLAYNWCVPTQITLEDDLAIGDYTVFGMDVFGGDTAAVRLVFNNQVYCPGVLCQTTATQRVSPINYYGVGVMGKFRSNIPPQIQTLGTAAGNEAITGYLLCG